MFFDQNDAQASRLPVYLLLDVSATMAGAPIEALYQGVQVLFSELLNLPHAEETVYLSVITFGTTVQVLRPLTELLAFEPPVLRTRGASALAAALDCLMVCLEQDIRPASSGQAGDYRPLLFIMTDGQPTDAWQPSMKRLRKHHFWPAAIVAIICGADSLSPALSEMGDVTLTINQLTGERISSLFKWLTLDDA